MAVGCRRGRSPKGGGRRGPSNEEIWMGDIYRFASVDPEGNALVTRWSSNGSDWSERLLAHGQSTKFAPVLVDDRWFGPPLMAYIANNDSNDILSTRLGLVTSDGGVDEGWQDPQ